MSSPAKRKMAMLRALRVEYIRTGKLRRVMIACIQMNQQTIPTGNFFSSNAEGSCRTACQELHRASKAKYFFYNGRDQIGMLSQMLEVLGALQQRIEALPQTINHGPMACAKKK